MNEPAKEKMSIFQVIETVIEVYTCGNKTVKKVRV